jgi:hypothetical protein
MTNKLASIIIASFSLYWAALGNDSKENTSEGKQTAQSVARIRLLTKETSMGVLPLMVDYRQTATTPDQTHIVYPVMTGGAWRLFKDGVEMATGKAYAQIAFPKFGPDGRHLAYYARLRGGGWTTVVDDRESPQYDMPVAAFPIFSPNSTNVASFMNRGGSQILVVDRREERVSKEAYLENGIPSGKEAIDNRSFVFSPDGRSFAYVVVSPDRQWVVSNGVAGVKYDLIGPPGPCFSPDGSHLVYGARTGSNNCVIVDNGKEVRRARAAGIRDLVFNSDGSKLAYIEVPEGGAGFQMVVGGERQRRYPTGAPETFRFSPDGKRFIYLAGTESSEQMIVVDGKEYGPYAGVAPNTWSFSPDSKHFAYGATRGAVTFAVVDGQELGRFDYIARRSVVFSPDSKHRAFVAVRDGKAHIVVDRTEGEGFDLIKIPDSDQFYGNLVPVFDALRKFHLLAARLTNSADVELMRVDVEIASE